MPTPPEQKTTATARERQMTKRQRNTLDEAIRTAARASDRQKLTRALDLAISTLWAIGACGRADSGSNCGAAADRCLTQLAAMFGVDNVR